MSSISDALNLNACLDAALSWKPFRAE